MNEKFCRRCNKIKPASDFGKDKWRGDGLTTKCRECRNPLSKAWRDKNKDRVKELNRLNKEKRKEFYSDPKNKLKYRNLELKRRFGITHEDYEKMLLSQNNVCMICKRHRVASNKYFMAVDHCHKTGKIRGILCNWCNRGLGAFEDNTEALDQAIKYLKGELK